MYLLILGKMVTFVDAESFVRNPNALEVVTRRLIG